MDVQGNLTTGQNTALVMLAFLQADCRNSECTKELLSLSQEVSHNLDISLQPQRRIDPRHYGEIEHDGHLSSSITASIGDILPSVELHRHDVELQHHRDHVDAAAIHQVADELREIAALFESSIVAQATRSLSRSVMNSSSYEWKDHFSNEVNRLMKQDMSLRDLPQERVLMALTLTLVKGVFVQAPQLLRNLFDTALQYINQER